MSDDPTAEITDADVADDLAILNKAGDDLVETPDEPVAEVAADLPLDTGEKDEPAELTPALKAKYPNIFKEFPELRKAVYHEKEFLKLFGTVEEAKEANLKAENQDYLLGEIEKGNLKPLLSGMKELDEATFKLFATKVLPAIYAESKDVYYHIIDPILIRVLQSTYNEGVKSKNDNLLNSAQHIAKHLFGDVNVLNAPAQLTPQSDPDREQFEKEKKDFLAARLRDASITVESDITKGIIKEIETGLTGLTVSGYIKKVIVKEIQDEVDVKLTQMPEHMSQMKALWTAAAKAGYPSEMLARITSTYLARAKPLIPSIRSKVKAELVKSKTPVANGKLQVAGAAPAAKRSGPVDAKKVDWSKTTDAQFMAGEITYKK